MPRYFFDVTDAGRLTRDAFGSECADDQDARNEALDLLPALARDLLSHGDRHELVVAARNEAGAVVYEASLTLDGRWWPGRR